MKKVDPPKIEFSTFSTMRNICNFSINLKHSICMAVSFTENLGFMGLNMLIVALSCL